MRLSEIDYRRNSGEKICRVIDGRIPWWPDLVHRPRHLFCRQPLVTNEIPLKFNTACVTLLHFIDRTAAARSYVPAGFLVPVKEKLLLGLYNRITRTWPLHSPDQKFIPMLLATYVGVYGDFSCFNPQKISSNKVTEAHGALLFINNVINLFFWRRASEQIGVIYSKCNSFVYMPKESSRMLQN